MLMPELIDLEEEEEVGGVWIFEDGVPALLKDFIGLEHMFLVETADSEALEPHMLTEVKRRSNWPLWEAVIHEELTMLKVAGTWVFEKASSGANIIDSKWVFVAKKDAMEDIVRQKA